MQFDVTEDQVKDLAQSFVTAARAQGRQKLKLAETLDLIARHLFQRHDWNNLAAHLHQPASAATAAEATPKITPDEAVKIIHDAGWAICTYSQEDIVRQLIQDDDFCLVPEVELSNFADDILWDLRKHIEHSMSSAGLDTLMSMMTAHDTRAIARLEARQEELEDLDAPPRPSRDTSEPPAPVQPVPFTPEEKLALASQPLEFFSLKVTGLADKGLALCPQFAERLGKTDGPSVILAFEASLQTFLASCEIGGRHDLGPDELDHLRDMVAQELKKPFWMVLVDGPFGSVVMESFIGDDHEEAAHALFRETDIPENGTKTLYRALGNDRTTIASETLTGSSQKA